MNASKPSKVVIDANVLIHSRAQFPFQKALIPPSVHQEIKSDMSKLKMQKLDLGVIRPSKGSVEQVGEKSNEICSPTSEQDEEALALALDKQIPLVTDDKALQNLALHLDADFDTFNTEKVSEKREWKKVCDNCGERITGLPCPRCGGRSLRRKRVQNS